MEDQNFTSLSMEGLRAIGAPLQIKAKSKEQLKAMLVDQSCHLLIFSADWHTEWAGTEKSAFLQVLLQFTA